MSENRVCTTYCQTDSDDLAMLPRASPKVPLNAPVTFGWLVAFDHPFEPRICSPFRPPGGDSATTYYGLMGIKCPAPKATSPRHKDTKFFKDSSSVQYI